MTPMRKIDNKLFADLWKRGVSGPEIAKQLGTSTVYVYIKRRNLKLKERRTRYPLKPLSKTVDVISYIERNQGAVLKAELHQNANINLVKRMLSTGDLYPVELNLSRGTGSFKRNQQFKIFKPEYWMKEYYVNSRTNLIRFLAKVLLKPDTRETTCILKSFLRTQKLTDAEVLALKWMLGIRTFSPSQVKGNIQLDGIIPARRYQNNESNTETKNRNVAGRC